MIEKITELDKQQYATTANFFSGWIELHPYPEEDDDFHRTIRMSALTYLSLYDNFLKLFQYISEKECIEPKRRSKLH